MNSELLLLLHDERPWVAYAACRDSDPYLFFPGADGDTSKAVTICNSCAVKEQCLDYALTARERYGVWGGTTERERRRLLRRSA